MSTHEALAEALTSIGLEVDSLEQVEEIPGGLKGVIVAEVVECVEHPDSDHLHITKLNTGEPEFPPVLSVRVTKQIGISPFSMA